jgi:hypothetical protein
MQVLERVVFFFVSLMTLSQLVSSQPLGELSLASYDCLMPLGADLESFGF